MIAINTSMHHTSQIGEILLLGVEEIISRSGMNAVLNLAHLTPEGTLEFGEIVRRMEYKDIAAVTQALESMYGPRGGRGIALRAGRASYKYILRQNGTVMGITDLNFRLLPVPARLKTGLDALALLMSKIGDEQVSVVETDQAWIWRSQRCPLCWQRSSKEAVCHFTVGLLQEFFAWASSGRVYSVTETECQAAGADACLFQIDKKALD
jgi:predicted hydrocarbon binding protein